MAETIVAVFDKLNIGIGIRVVEIPDAMTLRNGYREHDHIAAYQECDTCHLCIGEGITTEYDAAYYAQDDPDRCPVSGCDGTMALPPLADQP